MATAGVGLELCSSWGDGDVEAERLDPPLEPLRLDGGIVSALEVLGAGVVVEGAVGEQVPGDIEDGVRDRDGGLVRALAVGRSCEYWAEK